MVRFALIVLTYIYTPYSFGNNAYLKFSCITPSHISNETMTAEISILPIRRDITQIENYDLTEHIDYTINYYPNSRRVASNSDKLNLFFWSREIVDNELIITDVYLDNIVPNFQININLNSGASSFRTFSEYGDLINELKCTVSEI